MAPTDLKVIKLGKAVVCHLILLFKIIQTNFELVLIEGTFPRTIHLFLFVKKIFSKKEKTTVVPENCPTLVANYLPSSIPNPQNFTGWQPEGFGEAQRKRRAVIIFIY